MIDLLRVKETLKKHEGVKNELYYDSLGYLTIGVGRLLDTRKGGRLSDDEVEYLLDNDVERAYADARSRIRFFDSLKPAQQEALVNMCFQMGIKKLLEFKKMLAALEAGDLPTARVEALDSLWARQTKGRALEVVGMLTGGGV